MLLAVMDYQLLSVIRVESRAGVSAYVLGIDNSKVHIHNTMTHLSMVPILVRGQLSNKRPERLEIGVLFCKKKKKEKKKQPCTSSSVPISTNKPSRTFQYNSSILLGGSV